MAPDHRRCAAYDRIAFALAAANNLRCPRAHDCVSAIVAPATNAASLTRAMPLRG
jgi:hypothetical protein